MRFVILVIFISILSVLSFFALFFNLLALALSLGLFDHLFALAAKQYPILLWVSLAWFIFLYSVGFLILEWGKYYKAKRMLLISNTERILLGLIIALSTPIVLNTLLLLSLGGEIGFYLPFTIPVIFIVAVIVLIMICRSYPKVIIAGIGESFKQIAKYEVSIFAALIFLIIAYGLISGNLIKTITFIQTHNYSSNKFHQDAEDYSRLVDYTNNDIGLKIRYPSTYLIKELNNDSVETNLLGLQQRTIARIESSDKTKQIVVSKLETNDFDKIVPKDQIENLNLTNNIIYYGNAKIIFRTGNDDTKNTNQLYYLQSPSGIIIEVKFVFPLNESQLIQQRDSIVSTIVWLK